MGEDRPAGEYYYAVGAVNEFTETLSETARVLVVSLSPGLSPLVGFIIVMTAIGLAGVVLMRRYYLRRRDRGVRSSSLQSNTVSKMYESNA